MPRPRRFTPGKDTRYPQYRCLGGFQGRSGRVQKISPYRDFVVRLYSVLHPYLCLCLECPAFCLFVFTYTHTTQTYMPHAEFQPATPASDQPQTLLLRPLGHGYQQHKHPCRRLDSIPGTSSPKSVAIPTELSRPILRNNVICTEKLTFQ